MSFTARDLEQAIEANFENDEESNWLEMTMSVPNPDYDPMAYKNYRKAAQRKVEEALTNGELQAMWDETLGRFYETKNVPMIVAINGVEYPVKSVQQIGGMDEGSYAAVIVEVAGRTFRKQGSYYSHDGYYWDGDFSEVTLKTKIVSVYE